MAASGDDRPQRRLRQQVAGALRAGPSAAAALLSTRFRMPGIDPETRDLREERGTDFGALCGESIPAAARAGSVNLPGTFKSRAAPAASGRRPAASFRRRSAANSNILRSKMTGEDPARHASPHGVASADGRSPTPPCRVRGVRAGALLVAAPAAAVAEPGDLDPAFGQGVSSPPPALDDRRHMLDMDWLGRSVVAWTSVSASQCRAGRRPPHDGGRAGYQPSDPPARRLGS